MDPLGRSGLGADAATRRVHTNLAHASVPDMRLMLMAARASQPILDALARFSCAQCDAMTAPKIPRGVSVPQTVATLRYVAMDVKWLPGWEEDVRIKSVNIVDEASNMQHIYPFLRDRDIGGSSTTVSSVDRILRKAPLAQSRCESNQLGETLQRALEARGRGHPNSWTFLERHMSKSVGLRCTAVISRTCWREFWLRFGQALGTSGSNASTRLLKPRTPSQGGAATAHSR